VSKWEQGKEGKVCTRCVQGKVGTGEGGKEGKVCTSWRRAKTEGSGEGLSRNRMVQEKR
jgi:hypothetical protein